MSDGQKVFIALVASLIVHFVIIEVVAALWLVEHSNITPRAQPDLSQLTVTLMPVKPVASAGAVVKSAPASPPPPPAIPAMTPPDIDSDGLRQAKKAPDHAMFQSDANMVAGSQLPATGNIPLPSMAGPNRDFLDFAARKAAAGRGQNSMTAPPAPPASASAVARALPVQTPNGVTEVQRASTQAPQAQPTPELAAQSTPAPTPKPVPSAPPDSIALGTPTPPPSTPRPTPMEMARLTLPPTLRAHPDMAPTVTNPVAEPQRQTQAPAMAATQRELEKTRINGGISRPGAPAVDANETPFGRYHQQISNLIGSRWNLYLQDHPKDVGEVTIVVKIDPSGKVVGAKVVANHSLDDLAELSTRAIMESDLPPVPDDLAPMLRDGKLEISFKFHVYDPSDDSPGR